MSEGQRDPVKQIADFECNSEPTVQQHTYVGIQGVTVRNGSDYRYDKWSHRSMILDCCGANIIHLYTNVHIMLVNMMLCGYGINIYINDSYH